MSRSAPRVRWLAALVVLACCALLAAGAEGWVRARRPPLDLWALTGRTVGENPMAAWAAVDAFAAYRARPGRYGRGEGKSVNPDGFISTPPLRAAKEPGTVRVVFLGGSSTAGTGRDLADAETWPWRAVERLRERLPGARIELINGALGGYTTFESYGRLWGRIRFFSPDVVVVYHGWNEMYYFGQVDDLDRWRTLEDGTWSLDRRRRVASVAPHWIDPWVRSSQLLTRLRLRLSPERNGEAGEAGRAERRDGDAPALAADFDARGVEVFRTNLRLLRETAAVLGAELFVAKQATLMVPDLPEAERARCRADYHGFDYAAHVRAYDALYAVIDEEVEASRVIDATPLSGVRAYFHDHVHPTVEGAEALSGIVADALEDVVRARGYPDDRATRAGRVALTRPPG